MDGQAFQTTPPTHHHPSPDHHDCSNGSGNFEQLMNLINGGNAGVPNTNFNPNYDGNEFIFNGDICPTTPKDMYDFSCVSVSGSNPGSILSSVTAFDEEDSSVSVRQTKKITVDRARMLISERRRRSQMKEKLLALRALVPNLSMMDKASMVGDAISYVQDLQMQIKKLRTEVAGLELSLEADEEGGGRGGGRMRFKELLSTKPKKNQVADKKHPACRKMLQMDVIEVGEREFYLRLACNRGEGVAVALYRALESQSLTCFEVQSSNVSSLSDRYVMTSTLNVRKGGEEMNVPTLKKLIAGAFHNQGFEFKTSHP